VGYGLFGPASDLQPAHSLAAFAAVLLAVFANGWVVLFLSGSGRALRRLSGRSSKSPGRVIGPPEVSADTGAAPNAATSTSGCAAAATAPPPAARSRAPSR